MIDFAPMIAKLTYKPGWKFRQVRGGLYNYDQLVILAQVQNSHDPEQIVEFTMMRVIPVFLTGETFLPWVTMVIAEAEYHELREFLRYDGALVDDPHKADPVT